jgi:hypothetical protein
MGKKVYKVFMFFFKEALKYLANWHHIPNIYSMDN